MADDDSTGKERRSPVNFVHRNNSENPSGAKEIVTR